MRNNDTLPQIGFVRLPVVLKMLPIGKSTWWDGVRAGRFPKPVKLGERTTAWRVEDIRSLIDHYSLSSSLDQKEGRDSKEGQ